MNEAYRPPARKIDPTKGRDLPDGTLNDNDRIAVVSASGADIRNGQISRRITAGERTRIDLEFAETYTGPIELQAIVEPEKDGAHEGQ